MIVLVESNFVIELGFLQEECEDADRIVELAERHAIELVVPAYSLGEPYDMLIRRRNDRRSTLDKLRRELQTASRSRGFADLREMSEKATDAFAATATHERNGLDGVVRRLIACATVTALSKDIITNSFAAQVRYELGPQDSLVFASVDEFVRASGPGPKLFINKNHKDFLTTEIQDHFGQFECKLLPQFASAREYIEKGLR
jgi:predicted nucleic acid-binding protein